ncbi:TolC family protein [Dysgonomonas sp. 216]|uniref:TolC family protein n=1 Tax=Dysgonomonas sp. 216 TaxID=2302934 RepID=UPI0013D02FA9|nr:TolC family protein [Dysgonomonas sp. 216]NDW18891.1 TolC family protein [Dysgonomonas sp. 216]
MKKIIILLLVTSLGSVSDAQSVLTLKRGIELGLEKNYEIQIVRNQQQILDNDVTIGNAGYLPTLDLSTGYSGTINNTDQRKPTGETVSNDGVHNQTLNAGVNLNWTIFDGFNIQANHSRLKELKLRGELNTRLTVEDFISQFTTAYYNYIKQTISLKNLKYAVLLSKERVRIVEARHNIGTASMLELQQARVDYNTDNSKLIKQHEVLYTLRTRLNEMIVSDNIDNKLTLADTLISFNPLLNKEEILDKALRINTELLLAQKEGRLSQLNLRMLQSENYPYLKVNAGYGYTQNVYETGTYDREKRLGFNYGVTLGFNLFDGFNRRRKQKNAKLEIENKQLEYQQTELAVRADFANMWMAYLNNMKLEGQERDNLKTARANFDIAMDRYKLGDLAGIEIREAQNSLLEAEERLVQSQYDTKLCEISLMLISGQIVSYVE